MIKIQRMEHRIRASNRLTEKSGMTLRPDLRDESKRARPFFVFHDISLSPSLESTL